MGHITTDNRDPTETVLVFEDHGDTFTTSVKVSVDPIDLFENMLENNFGTDFVEMHDGDEDPETQKEVDQIKRLWQLWDELKPLIKAI